VGIKKISVKYHSLNLILLNFLIKKQLMKGVVRSGGTIGQKAREGKPT